MPSHPNPPNALTAPAKALKRVKCRNCLKPFLQNRWWQKFCCHKCRCQLFNDDKRLTKIEQETL